MHIHWQGFSYLKFITGETTILADPFKKRDGLVYGAVKADVVLAGTPQAEAMAQGNPFTINGPGEYEVQGVFVYGIPELDEAGKPVGRNFFVVKAEGMSIGVLGAMQQTTLTDEQLGIIEGVDILCLPVGGGDVLSAKQAAGVMNKIEPRLVVPTFFSRQGVKQQLDSVDVFLKEVGAKQVERGSKLKITRKQLPQEDIHFFVFEN